ncbi:MAG: biotin transporter BioY [Candidatus Paceibacterota bacterium]|jgi:biotin transport system substrate-specific component
MEITAYLDNTDQLKARFFEWRRGLGIVQSLLLALAYACLTGLMAQTSFYLPWTPVPITGQTFAVLLGAVLLGRWGGTSQIIYTASGIAGVPWFAGWKGGLAVIAGPTGGYLIGFIFAAFFVGYFVEKYERSKSYIGLAILMLLANFVFVYGFGLAQLYIWLSVIEGSSMGFQYLLSMGALPFIIGDTVKILAAVAVAKAALPKEKEREMKKYCKL